MEEGIQAGPGASGWQRQAGSWKGTVGAESLPTPLSAHTAAESRGWGPNSNVTHEARPLGPDLPHPHAVLPRFTPFRPLAPAKAQGHHEALLRAGLGARGLPEQRLHPGPVSGTDPQEASQCPLQPAPAHPLPQLTMPQPSRPGPAATSSGKHSCPPAPARVSVGSLALGLPYVTGMEEEVTVTGERLTSALAEEETDSHT